MRKRWVALLAVVGGVWWLRGGDGGDGGARRAATAKGPQAAVLADGFAVLAGKQLTVHERDGRVRHQATLQLDQDVRFVGSRGGATVGWKDGGKVALAFVDDDGAVIRHSVWGKNVRGLCDGAASNERRFAIGWLQNDDRVYIVHGPVAPAAALAVDEVEPAAEPAARPSWCGVASAEDNVALVWREGRNLQMGFCSSKACRGLVVKVPIDARETLLGFGCLRDRCLFAVRDPQGQTRLLQVTDRRRTTATTPLADAAAGTTVSVVGAGSGAFAVAYLARSGKVAVLRVSVEGGRSTLAQLDGPQVPGLAWADGRLLMAGATTTVVSLPR